MSFFTILWLWVAFISILLGVYVVEDIFQTPVIPKYTYLKNYNFWKDISLSKEDVSHFYSHGFVVIQDAIPVSIIDKLYESRPVHTLSWYLWPVEYLFSAITKVDIINGCMWVDLDIFRDFWYFSPLIEQVISPLFAYKNILNIRFLTDLIFAVQLKPMFVGVFHQDSTSYGILNENSQSVSVWMTLMDIDAEVEGGSLYFVNKSSKLMPDYCQSFDKKFVRDLQVQKSCMQFFDDHTQSHLTNDLIFMSEYYNKGDILLFDKFTFHKTQPLKNASRKRFAYVGRFVDGDSFLNDTLTGAVRQKKNLCEETHARMKYFSRIMILIFIEVFSMLFNLLFMGRIMLIFTVHELL